MSSIDELLTSRTSAKQANRKMQDMAKRSAAGNLSGFSGVFTLTELSEQQKHSIEALLKGHAEDNADIAADYHTLLFITGEIKAIDNQALLLHGERIAKAQKILIQYKEGAFTAWLKVAYGNRQTPYNFLHYYYFHETVSKELRPLLGTMPKQAIYTLASREGPLKQKEKLISNYAGETKEEVLKTIRRTFPLVEKDKRGRNVGIQLLKVLQKVSAELQEHTHTLSYAAKQELRKEALQIQSFLQ